MDLRHCQSCKFVKPVDHFYAGVPSRCKDCHKAAVKANRLANIEHYKARDNARANRPDRVAARSAYQKTERGRAAGGRAKRKWSASNTERRAAQVALGNAVRDGRVIPWPACAAPDCSAKPEAHHPDYSAPLDVVWLCPPHHKQAHALLREAA